MKILPVMAGLLFCTAPAVAQEQPREAVSYYLAHPDEIKPVLDWCKDNLYAPSEPDKAALAKVLEQAQNCLDATTATLVITRAQQAEALRLLNSQAAR